MFHTHLRMTVFYIATISVSFYCHHNLPVAGLSYVPVCPFLSILCRIFIIFVYYNGSIIDDNLISISGTSNIGKFYFFTYSATREMSIRNFHERQKLCCDTSDHSISFVGVINMQNLLSTSSKNIHCLQCLSYGFYLVYHLNSFTINSVHK